MDFLSNLFPTVPSLELDPSSQFQNMTFLQNAFIVTFLASLGATTIRNRFPWICSVSGGTTRCEPGETDTGRVCVEVVAQPANYLSAINDCGRRGGSLATVQSQEEQDAIYALTGSTGAWIGLTDLLFEGNFSWVDGSSVSYTNFRAGQPNNGNDNQHCTWIRPDGFWDDVICKKEQHYVCQKLPQPNVL